MRCTPIRYTPVRCTPVRCTSVRCKFMRYIPMRCTPVEVFEKVSTLALYHGVHGHALLKLLLIEGRNLTRVSAKLYLHW